MNSENAKCPFKTNPKPRGNFSVQFEEVPQQSFLGRFASSASEFFSKISLSSLKNARQTYLHGDLNRQFTECCKYDEKISDFKTPVGTQYIITDHAILQLVLTQFRNQEGGLFYAPESEKIFVDGLIQDLYPEEMSKISDREKEIISSVIFTAESAHVPSLRARAMGFLKQKSVQEYKEQINQIAAEILDNLTSSEKQSCDPAYLVFEFAITVMGRLFMGYQTTRQNYQKVVTAFVAVSKHISDSITRRPLNEKEKLEYKTALQTIRDLIEENVTTKPTPPLIEELRSNGLSEFAIKAYIFFFYLAGTETTSAVTHYLLLQLGRNENKHYQEMIRKGDSTLLEKCIIEALRLNPAAFIVGRALRKNILITMRDENHNLIWSKSLRKGHYIINWIAGAGKNPDLYTDPDAFNPLRYESIPKYLPWLPFGSGQHTCPGQFLAKAEMESFITEVLRRFSIQAIPSTDPIESKGTFTLHADPLNKIKVQFDPV